MNDVAHLQETTTKLQSAFSNYLGSNATSDLISSGEVYLAQGVTFTTLISTITSSTAESKAIAASWQSVLGRVPDSGTISTDESALRSGATLASQRSDLAHSQEATNDIGTIYSQVLGRPVDAGGLSTWENSLAGNQTLAGVRPAVAHSAEAASDIGTIYSQVLGRPVDAGSLMYWENSLAGTQTLAGVRSAVASSAEAASDINIIYKSVLNRAVDSGGLAKNEQVLSAVNGTLTQVRYNTVYSTEATNDITNAYSSIFGQAAGSTDIAGVQIYLNAGHGISEVEADLATPINDTSNDVIVYRVEAANVNQRISIDGSSNVTIPTLISKQTGLDVYLYLNFGDEGRAFQYLFQKLAQLPTFVLKAFDVPLTFSQSVSASAVTQANGPSNPTSQLSPMLVFLKRHSGYPRTGLVCLGLQSFRVQAELLLPYQPKKRTAMRWVDASDDTNVPV